MRRDEIAVDSAILLTALFVCGCSGSQGGGPINHPDGSAEAGAAPGTFTGPHPAGSRLEVRGRRFAGEPAFVTIEPIPPAEVLVLVRARG